MHQRDSGAVSLFSAARACLDASTPEAKLAATFTAAAAFARGELSMPANAPPPQPIRMPGRPARPALVPTRSLPQRGLGSDEGRAAFVHAISHIEFNAIDLAWDAVSGSKHRIEHFDSSCFDGKYVTGIEDGYFERIQNLRSDGAKQKRRAS